MTTEKRCTHCGQRIIVAMLRLLDDDGKPLDGTGITMQVVDELFGISGDGYGGFQVTHLPTGRRIAERIVTAAQARIFCEALARNPEPWRFTTMDEFKQRRAELATLRNAALQEARKERQE